VAEAVAAGQVVMLMLPDEAMARVYRDDVAPGLQPGAALGFAHGFAVAFGQVRPEAGRPCFLCAPKGQGDMLLAAHAEGGGVPGLLAVTEDSPPATWDLAAAYALAAGCLQGGGFVTTFRQECVSDQFGEQAVLCGGVIELLKAAFEIMVEAGYGEENAYFECVHELKLITDLLHRHGIDGLRNKISGTASYGGLTRGPRVIDAAVRERMRQILGEIESGEFAREFLTLSGHPENGTRALARLEAAGPLAETGRRMLPRLRGTGGNTTGDA
jgi:ketol-acid reductoisomerase